MTTEQQQWECPVCHLRRDEIYEEDLYKHLRLYHSKEDLAKWIFEQQSRYNQQLKESLV